MIQQHDLKIWALGGLRGNIIRTAPCWVVWHNVHNQQHTYVSSSYRSSRLGLLHWDPYAMHRGGCLEWSGPGGIQALSARPTSFLQCFDTVGLVMWPVKIVPDMTYNVFGGTLNLALSIMSCARFSTIAPPTTMLSNCTYLMKFCRPGLKSCRWWGNPGDFVFFYALPTITC